MTQKLSRVTLTPNEVYEMDFDVEGSHFLVKNFGNGEQDSPSLYVSLDGETIDEHCFKILSGGYQEVCISDMDRIDTTTSKVFLKSSGAIEVEVQITRW